MANATTALHRAMLVYVEEDEIIVESSHKGAGWTVSDALEHGKSNYFTGKTVLWARIRQSEVSDAWSRLSPVPGKKKQGGVDSLVFSNGVPLHSVRSSNVGRPVSVSGVDLFGQEQPPTVEAPWISFGIAGILDIFCGSVLLLISSVRPVGCVLGHAVFCISGINALLLKEKGIEPKEEWMEYDNEHVETVISFLTSGSFFFSYSFDLTSRCQSQSVRELALWRTVTKEYFFNRHMMQPLMELELDRWILPLLCGHVSLCCLSIPSQPLTMILISRRRTTRVGSRYRSRGVDAQGDVANEVETEQILVGKEEISAFVMLRGSVPVYWTQRGFALRPPIAISPVGFEHHQAALCAHLQRLSLVYGKIVAVNLLDAGGREGHLTHEYARQLREYNQALQGSVVEPKKPQVHSSPLLKGRNVGAATLLTGLMGVVPPVHDEKGMLADGLAHAAEDVLHLDEQHIFLPEEPVEEDEDCEGWVVLDEKEPEAPTKRIFAHGGGVASQMVTYIPFDFHKICAKTKWDRLSLLLDDTAHASDLLGCFHQSLDGTTLVSQRGVFRVNCLDCLDRTNVVQSLFGLRVVETLVGHPLPKSLEGTFKSCWAENGDDISRLYAGTAALKGEITRGGQHRTFGGMVSDGMNSVTRSYINHFHDSIRHACLEWMVGTRTLDRTRPMQFLNDREELEGWEAEKQLHIESCRKDVIVGNEMYLGGWVILSINKWDAAQERILLLSSTSYYRVKWNFDHGKVENATRYPLSSITLLEQGRLFQKRFRGRVEGMYGLRVHHQESGRATRLLPRYRTYCPFLPCTATDVDEQEALRGMASALERATRLQAKTADLERKSMARPLTDAYNRLNLGSWH